MDPQAAGVDGRCWNRPWWPVTASMLALGLWCRSTRSLRTLDGPWVAASPRVISGRPSIFLASGRRDGASQVLQGFQIIFRGPGDARHFNRDRLSSITEFHSLFDDLASLTGNAIPRFSRPRDRQNNLRNRRGRAPAESPSSGKYPYFFPILPRHPPRNGILPGRRLTAQWWGCDNMGIPSSSAM